MTLQIARIASTRLGDIQRPIRLSYAGQVLRVKGSNLRPKRQFGQIGVELVGSPSPKADSEIILMAVKALSNLGIKSLSIDLCLPTVVPAIYKSQGINSTAIINRLRIALDEKDKPAVELLEKELGNETNYIFSSLLESVGPVDEALKLLRKIKLPQNAVAELNKLSDVISCLKTQTPDLTITIDPVETRGYKYHTGVTFTFFALNVRGEIGRGGRYLVNDASGNKAPETATGASLYIDTVLRALPKPIKKNRVLVSSAEPIIASKLREEGWIVIESFDENKLTSGVLAKEAGCTHFWNGTKVVAIKYS
jgi:ATP phosphoribosyltransferase regulatory subunit